MSAENRLKQKTKWLDCVKQYVYDKHKHVAYITFIVNKG